MLVLNKESTNLAEWLDVDAHWLRFGEELTGSASQQRKRWDSKLSPQERQTLEAFVQLSPEKRRVVGDLIKLLAN